MVDPSVATTMEGKLKCVCVGDHAGNHFAAETRSNSAFLPGVTAPITPQFYAFDCLVSNLDVSEDSRQISRDNEMLGSFLRDESGATAIEYSLIAGFIALAIIAAVGLTGQRLVELFESLLT
jgi:pilus assembly protein Flp/PilA